MKRVCSGFKWHAKAGETNRLGRGALVIMNSCGRSKLAVTKIQSAYSRPPRLRTVIERRGFVNCRCR